jgi:hypothetical protein
MLRRVLIWLALAAAVSFFGAATGRVLLTSLNDPIPTVLDALHAHADPAPAFAPAPARPVVIVLIDGLGEAAFNARLAEGALGPVQWKASLDTGVPSLSRPVYHAILTGVPQWASGIRQNGYARGRADSVPDRVRAGGGKVAWMLGGVQWFHELFGAPGDTYEAGPAALSAETFARVCRERPTLTVIHFTEVDSAGHHHGAASDEYLDASRRTMAMVAALRAEARDLPGGRDAIWFVGADHGHMARGGHGGPEAAVRRVSWVALYDVASGNGESEPVDVAPGDTVASLAPTFARALGVDAPRESMADGLPFRAAALGAPLRSDPERVGAVEAARARHDTGLLASEATRVAVAIAATIAAFGVLAWKRGKRGIAESVCAVVAVAGFLVAGPALSLSAVRTEPAYLIQAVTTMSLAAAIAWVAARRSASPVTATLASAVLPLAALVVTRGSLGLSDATSVEAVLWPSMGLVPVSVCAGIAVVEGVAWGGGGRPRSASVVGQAGAASPE